VSRWLTRAIHAELAGQAGGRDWPLLVASDLEIGVDPTPGPGSRSISYRDASAQIVEACRRLADLGAQRVVLMTFHGSPLHSLAIDAGVKWLARHGIPALSPLNLLLTAMLELRVEDYADAYATVPDEEERRAMMREGPSDFHAGFMETSMALHYAPESVDPIYKELPPCPEIVPNGRLLAASRAAARFGRAQLARELQFAAVGVGWHALRPFPAYTSRPARASAEAGATMAKHIVPQFARVTDRVLRGEEAAPPPIMQWMASATLGGTLATEDSIPLDAIARFDTGQAQS